MIYIYPSENRHEVIIETTGLTFIFKSLFHIKDCLENFPGSDL